MEKRGWTPDDISATIANGKQFSVPNNVNPGNTATRFENPATRKSLVRDDVTKEILHLGGAGFGYD